MGNSKQFLASDKGAHYPPATSREPGSRGAWQHKYTKPLASTSQKTHSDSMKTQVHRKRDKHEKNNRNKTDHTWRGTRCGQRKHGERFSGQRGEQSNVNISSTLTVLQRVKCRRVTYMDRPTSRARSSWSNHPQSSGTSAARHFKHMCRLEAITPLGRFPSLHKDF